MSRGLPVALAVLAAALLGPGTAAGDAPVPVFVYAAGPNPIHVRIAAGTVSPCNSASDTPLFEGTVSPDRPLSFFSPAACICEQHTSASFPDSEWSQGGIVCSCSGRRCRQSPVIRVLVQPSR
ncbi:MAG TPA: hypothetical protein VMI54_24315 [Polyangiaceae bacterium]|nr:hypothetical protein [Polyangiaceae bacterium]